MMFSSVFTIWFPNCGFSSSCRKCVKFIPIDFDIDERAQSGHVDVDID